MKEMKKYLGRNSRIAQIIENYEYRPQQISMAEAVINAIESKNHLMVEAGCGVGKSFSYLVPFILWTTKEKNRRVVISTYTKALQQQLIEKDIPVLSRTLETEFTAALCVGSENYICLSKLKRVWQNHLLDTPQEAEQFRKLYSWAESTPDGLKLNIDFNLNNSLWYDVCRTSDSCTERKCPYYKNCFYFKAKKQQINADILILNHHLLLMDIASEGMILPNYEAIVFDEGQNIEDTASNTLGMQVSLRGIKYLMSRIYKPNSSRSLIKKHNVLSSPTKKAIIDSVNLIKKQTDLFFTSILDELGTETKSHRINIPGMFENNLTSPLVSLSELLLSIGKKITDEQAKNEFKSFAGRCKNTGETLNLILNLEFKNYVYYIKTESGKKGVNCSLNATPVEVGSLLKNLVFDKIAPVVITSATLTVNNSFDFIHQRIGLADSKDIHLDSPFNYSENVLFYSPLDLPDPSYSYQAFKNKVSAKISEILEITKGRTFVLFTSYEMLNTVGENLIDRHPDLKFFLHGESPRKKIISEFTSNKNSVLLGTSTFWQGVDFPGRLLECVIITKLPFSVPDDPVTEARIENIKKQGKNPFKNYQVPVATLLFKQGFGRLIRHRNDFGIVCALDPRIRTRGYGKTFLNSLPGFRKVKNLNDLNLKYNELCRRYAAV